MASDSEDSAAATGDPDETVWPPPPTSPRVVAVRPSRRFLFSLSVPESLTGFKLPKWAKSACNNLATAFVAVLFYVKSPLLVKILLGCVLLGDGLLILSFLLGAGMVGYVYAVSAVTGQALPVSEKWQKDLTPKMWFGMIPNLMFFVWAFCFIFMNHLHLVNRIALVFWLALIVAGMGVAAVNGTKHWIVSRRQSAG